MKAMVYKIIVIILSLVVLSSIVLYILMPDMINVSYAVTVVTSFLSLLIIYITKGKKQNNNTKDNGFI